MQDGNYIGKYLKKDNQILRLNLVTNNKSKELAMTIKEQLEKAYINTQVIISDSEYSRNLKNINCDILLTGKTVSIKPESQEYLDFEVEKKQTKEETMINVYEKFKERANFIGLYFDSITIISSKNIKGNLNGNWFNIFYYVDTWYKVKEK